MNPLRMRAFQCAGLPGLESHGYDAVLGSLGFEARATAIPRALNSVSVRRAIPFDDRQLLSYDDNRRFYTDQKWDATGPSTDPGAADQIFLWFSEVASRPEVEKVAVDVSSMSRVRIGAVIEALVELRSLGTVQVDLLYTPSRFKAPDGESDPPVLSVEPVSGYYAGWWDDLDAPLHAIIGVGYELERASSAMDQLEPETADVYWPIGTDSRYREVVERANAALRRTTNVERHVDYDVSDPFGCFRQLEAAVHRRSQAFARTADSAREHGGVALAPANRVALVPLGPKIFAACAMLVGALHPVDVQVIRVTAGERQEPVDQESDGTVYGLSVLVGREAVSDVGPHDPGLLDG